jgi:hypothetical protein
MKRRRTSDEMSDCLSGCVVYGSMQYLEEGDERLSQRVHVVQLRADHTRHTGHVHQGAVWVTRFATGPVTLQVDVVGAGGGVDGVDAGVGRGISVHDSVHRLYSSTI